MLHAGDEDEKNKGDRRGKEITKGGQGGVQGLMIRDQRSLFLICPGFVDLVGQ